MKEHVDGYMGLGRRWIDELKGTFHTGWLIGAAAATLGVLGLTHIPQDSVPQALQMNRLDKVEHVVAYGMITALYMLALKPKGKSERAARRKGEEATLAHSLVPPFARSVVFLKFAVEGWLGLAVLIALGLAAIGAVDELTQPYVYRTCSIWDWTSDAIGIAGVCGFFILKRTAADGEKGNHR